MEYTNERNIKCPYCDWEDNDSWEFTEDSGRHTCGSCEKDFNVQREVEVTYSTSKIDCSDSEEKHQYKFHDLFIKKRDYNNGNWIDKPESEWEYIRIMICSKCDDRDYVRISKEQYECELSKV